MLSRLKKRGFALLAVSLLVPFLLFVLGPFILYQGNHAEFATPFTGIVILYLVPALGLVLITLAVGLVIPSNLFHYYLSLLTTIGILLWVQGNVLLWDYGLLDGKPIHWNEFGFSASVDFAVWGSLLIVSVFAAKNIARQSHRVALGLITCQLIYIVLLGYQSSDMWKSQEEKKHKIPQPQLYQFSAKQNIIHIVLDALQGDIFAEIVEEDRDYYRSLLQGFMFFDDAAGHFPTTYVSVPAYMASRLYRNQFPVSEFVHAVMSGPTLSNVFFKEGFDVDFIVGPGFYRDSQYTNFYQIPKLYRSLRENARLEAIEILDLVLFRSSPQYVKELIYGDQLWFLQQYVAKTITDQFSQFSHLRFVQDLVAKSTTERTHPVYKLIHLFTSHPPWIMNVKGEFLGKAGKVNRINIKNQQKAAMDNAFLILNRLKQLGIYDSALILIHSDHGAGGQRQLLDSDIENVSDKDQFRIPLSRASPVIAIKPPNATGPMTTSSVAIALADIPNMVFSNLGLKTRIGESRMFTSQEDQPTERTYLQYKWDKNGYKIKYFDALKEFSINGAINRKESWSRAKVYFAPTHPSAPQSLLEIVKRNGQGWSQGLTKADSLRVVDSEASFHMHLPVGEALLDVHLRSIPKLRQTVDVLVDGELIATWRLRKKSAKYYAYIPASAGRNAISKIEFHFIQEETNSDEGRAFAILFDSIKLVSRVSSPEVSDDRNH